MFSRIPAEKFQREYKRREPIRGIAECIPGRIECGEGYIRIKRT
jgi:hypothetical protein